MFEQLKQLIVARNSSYINGTNISRNWSDDVEKERVERRLLLLKKRKASLVQSNVRGRFTGRERVDERDKIRYLVYFEQLIKLQHSFYIEERIEEREAEFIANKLVSDRQVVRTGEPVLAHSLATRNEEAERRFLYDRRKAVQYAERWWNDYSPQYRHFTNNCTNFVSQCLKAGDAPMAGYPNRSKGWWYAGDKWSYSWSVAHSFKWYLNGAKTGLRGIEMRNAADLLPGDVICYDFQGDDRWDHTAIVVAKDEYGEPLVNAQTSNSRMRYWSYEDSTAWTEHISYKFFRIADEM